MEYGNTAVPVQGSPMPPFIGGFRINTDIDSLTSGANFTHLTKVFAFILQHKDNEKEIKNALRDLKVSTKAWFGVEVEFSIIDTTSEFQFFGFRFIPNFTTLQLMSNRPISGTNRVDWIPRDDSAQSSILGPLSSPGCLLCEIDRKMFYDPSNKFSPIDITTMFLYQLEWGLTDSNRTDMVTTLIREKITSENIDHRLVEFLHTPPSKNLLMIPYAIATMYTNFITKVPNSSIVSYGDMPARYNSLMNKLIGRYGKLQLINRPKEDLYGSIMNVINWIYDSVNDLKYSTMRFRKNLIDHMKSASSPGLSKIMLSVYRSFDASVKLAFEPSTATEAYSVFKSADFEKYTPEMKKMYENMLTDLMKKKWEHICEGINHQFTDDRGFALKVNQQQIDEIRVEVSTISTPEDKIFLLERLYKLIGTINNAQDMLADRKTAHRVRQNKQELQRMAEECQAVRQMILNTPIGPKRYGLFVQYPAGYEG